MIIVKLIGGLGNQMFQYATGRKLALERGVELKFDKGNLGAEVQPGVTPRDLEINLLNTKFVLATEEEILYFKKLNSNVLSRVFQRNFPFLLNRIYFAESGSSYMESISKLPGSAYLDGFWQSERYFSQIRNVLLEEFQPTQNLSETNQKLLSQIENTNSISLHFRRGDYVTNKEANNYHGLINLSYYQNAVERVAEKVKDPEFFVFSDDPDWVKENFKISFPIHFISENTGSKAIFDLLLMSKCKHNIIANSSFSWWGAWLNTNEEKQVIAPKNWFKDPSAKNVDLLPSSWIQME